MGVIYFILGIMGAAYVIIGGGVFLVFIASGGFEEAGGKATKHGQSLADGKVTK